MCGFLACCICLCCWPGRAGPCLCCVARPWSKAEKKPIAITYIGCATDNILIELGQKRQSEILPQNLVSLWLLNLNQSQLQSYCVYLDNQFPNRFSSESIRESDRYTTSSVTMTSSRSVHVWLSATQKLEKRLVETCLPQKLLVWDHILYEFSQCLGGPATDISLDWHKAHTLHPQQTG